MKYCIPKVSLEYLERRQFACQWKSPFGLAVIDVYPGTSWSTFDLPLMILQKMQLR